MTTPYASATSGTKIRAQAEYVCWRDGRVKVGRPQKKSPIDGRILPDADPGFRIAERWRKSFCLKGETGTVIDQDKMALAANGALTPHLDEASLKHGEWLPWLRRNAETLGFSTRQTATRLMMRGASNRQLTADLSEATAITISRKLWGNDNVRGTQGTGENEWYTPADIIARLDAFEQYMHDCGLYSIEDMRPINETRMRARWKLGRALKAVPRKPGSRTDVATSSGDQIRLYVEILKDLKLDKMAAQEAQRIGALPEDVFPNVFAKWSQRGDVGGRPPAKLTNRVSGFWKSVKEQLGLNAPTSAWRRT